MAERGEQIPDTTAEAVGKVGEALEYVERARGHLYSFHQLIGHADLLLGDAVDALRDDGHTELADAIATEMVGRNVINGRWTFQVVEEFDDTYWQPFREVVGRARELTGGVAHLHESRMKEDRRTHGHPHHTEGP
ncbi:hypothetical protein IA539_05880 [Gordonia sp. zg691]|uniref:Uncharacterized protein n=1 Tax=Gordonia jinghuaiqii TaxID=2758710 RepID=A0A7D7LXZ1_9ACTN|nr:hypothetical protein [Gordonia jinghuaiqii]MBD0860737.1 hypothetical protein [Gordonia jinghuaiqii]MCR5977994.1 hypothetical protein [Gordonia jinghuaiqii]QMT01536.1 hypothetical protein H1R19_22455 [Gordonia jinghuaiqii]